MTADGFSADATPWGAVQRAAWDAVRHDAVGVSA
jgi:hypothetical protein